MTIFGGGTLGDWHFYSRKCLCVGCGQARLSSVTGEPPNTKYIGGPPVEFDDWPVRRVRVSPTDALRLSAGG